ncbi:MAG: hypothetical protein ACJAUL_002939, partial [Paraglaciecola sp.]
SNASIFVAMTSVYFIPFYSLKKTDPSCQKET